MAKAAPIATGRATVTAPLLDSTPFIGSHLRASTVKGYKDLWADHLEARCGNVLLRYVRTCDVQKWIESVAAQDQNKKGEALGRRTLSNLKWVLSSIFKHAIQQGYFDSRNPVNDASIPPTPCPKETYAYSLEEIAQMLRMLSGVSLPVVAVAAYAGLRAGEIRGLEWDAYEPAKDEDSLGWLHVRRSVWRKHVNDPKTEKSKAAVPVIPQLAEQLDAWRKICGSPTKGSMFANGSGKPLSLESLYWRKMRPVLGRCETCRKSEDDHGKEEHKFKRDASLPEFHGWHSFRRGLASNLNRLGVDDSVIQGILRHSNIAVTQGYYIKTARPGTEAAMRQFSDSLSYRSLNVLNIEDGRKKKAVM